MAKAKNTTRQGLMEDLINSGRNFSDTTIMFHAQVARKAGLASPDHKYLGLLVKYGAMTAGDLATYANLTTGAVTGVIDRLEKGNFVSRQKDSADRRKVLVVPNFEEINKVLGPVFRSLQERLSATYQQFSKSELEVILRYMDSTCLAIEKLSEELK